MKHSEAVQFLEKLMFNIQRIRSNARQDTGLTEEILAGFEPYIFGENCLLPLLTNQLSLVNAGEKQLEPGEFYNLMFIAHKSDMIQGSFIFFPERTLPTPSIKWLSGWEPEN